MSAYCSRNCGAHALVLIPRLKSGFHTRWMRCVQGPTARKRERERAAIVAPYLPPHPCSFSAPPRAFLESWTTFRIFFVLANQPADRVLCFFPFFGGAPLQFIVVQLRECVRVSARVLCAHFLLLHMIHRCRQSYHMVTD